MDHTPDSPDGEKGNDLQKVLDRKLEYGPYNQLMRHGYLGPEKDTDESMPDSVTRARNEQRIIHPGLSAAQDGFDRSYHHR